MKKQKANENGITLVALVVTIIVLIILAGISVGAIIGDNGIISKSKNAIDEAEKMQNSTAQNRESLYGEIVGDKNQYEEAGTVGVNLELEKETDTSIIATANATDTKSEIISYTFYIRKITENDSAYVIIKKSDKLTNTVTCANLEKDMAYKVKVVAMDKDGVSKTAEKNIVLGDAIKISVTPISGPDSYPSIVMVTAKSVVSNIDYIELPNGETVEAKNGNFKLKTTYNSTKNGPIVFTAYDKDGNVGQLEYMEQNVINFETEWTIAEDNTTVTVPVTGIVDVYIDYGDGTRENITKANPTHTYAAGTYTMKISGRCTDFSSNTSTQSYITKLKKWGCLDNNSYSFNGCSKISNSIPNPHNKSFSNVTTFRDTFRDCTSLTGNIPENLFANCTKVTDFSVIFYNCSGLTGNISENLFANCPDVTTFYCTFFNCTGLTGSIPERLFHNNTLVTSFKYTFHGCSALIGDVPEGLFEKCTKVTNFGYTFYDCEGLTSIPESLFYQNPLVTSFRTTFYGCKGIKSIPDKIFFYNPEVTDFHHIFAYCTAIKEIPSEIFSKNTKVKDFSEAFAGCEEITAIPVGLFDNCPDVENFGGTFGGCSKLTSIPEGLFDKCTKVTNFGYTRSSGHVVGVFKHCSNLTGTAPELWNRGNVTSYSEAFKNCTKLDNYNDIPDDWK